MFDFRGGGAKNDLKTLNIIYVYSKSNIFEKVFQYILEKISFQQIQKLLVLYIKHYPFQIFSQFFWEKKTNLKTVKIGKICKSAPIIFAGGLCSKRIFILISLVVSFGRGRRGWPTGSCTRTPGGWGSPGRWGSLGTPRTWTLWRQSGCRTISRIWSWSNWRWPLFVLFWNIQKIY